MAASCLSLGLRYLRTPWVVVLLGVLLSGSVAWAGWQWYAARELKRRTWRVYHVHVYYYDLGTGELFVDWSSEIPPVVAPSGPDANNKPQGVRAYVFSCGDCSDESKRFVGWLETYTAEVKQMLLDSSKPGHAIGPGNFDAVDRGHLVSVPGSGEWVQANSEEGFKLMESAQYKCGTEYPAKPCFPGTGRRCIETTGPRR